ncbi:MAG TPA: hypothetical protein VML50_12825 [Anaeromyxobacter sp.]|nr:hypothetical protein [Anaeromyxobacter sp.]
MRAYVLPDARLRKLAGRFVRLDVDTEKPANAAFVEKYPIDAWPTLYVIDPATEAVVIRWAGTATVEQIAQLAGEGERALRARGASRAEEALARADRLAGERRHAEAAAAYLEALEAGGPAWSGRERAVEARLQALAFAGDAAGCAAAAERDLPTLHSPAARALAASAGLACALEIEGEEARGAALRVLEPAARRGLEAPGLLADDRSGLFEALAGAREAAGDQAGARAIGRRWLAYLEAEAARARTPLERSGLDGQRVSAAIQAGTPERALAPLLASERDLPGEFAPAAALARLHLELHQPAEARAAAVRALARAEGPRRIRVLVLRARAERELGEPAAARETLAQAVREGEALSPALRPTAWIAAARKELASLAPVQD